MSLAACATQGTLIDSSPAVCAAVKRSPPYSGKKIETAAGKPFRNWVGETNLTLDRLKCPDSK